MKNYEKITRNVYYVKENKAKTLQLSGLEFDADFRTYHDVRARIHEQAEHDWGVAAGLEVIQTGDFGLQVKPGVAIDGSGQVIVLASEDVPPDGNLGVIATRGHARGVAGLRYHPVQFQYARQVALQPKLEWRVFEPTVGLKAQGDLDQESRDKTDKEKIFFFFLTEENGHPYHVVLAVVELEADGKVKGLAPRTPCPLARKLVGVPAGEIRLRRSKATKDGDKETLTDTVAVTVRPTEHGVEIVGATETFRLDVTQTGTQKLAGMTFGATYVKFDQDIQTDKRIDGRDVSEDGKRLDEHLANKQNPHGVTLNQLGPCPQMARRSRSPETSTPPGTSASTRGLDENHRLKVAGNIHCDSISTGTIGEVRRPG